MLELLMTHKLDVSPNNQELIVTNDVGQPITIAVNWCRGIGTRSNLIYILDVPAGVTTAKVNLYSYDTITNVWVDLGLTTTSLSRLNYSPTLTAVNQNLLVYMALDLVYFYDIPSNVWTLKKVIGTGQSGYMHGAKGWLYGGNIYRYGTWVDSLGNRDIAVMSYGTSTDKHTGVFSDSRHNAVSNYFAPTILVGTKLYYFAMVGIVSYYDFALGRIIYTTETVPVAAYNTLVEYNGNILIFGDASGGSNVRLFNTTTNTVTLLTNKAIADTTRTFGFIDTSNIPNVYVAKRVDPDVCNFLKYSM